MAVCRKCGETIKWVKTQKGKFLSVNPSGGFHFTTCKADRMTRAEAEVLEAKVNAVPRITVGEFYVETEDNGIPPWNEFDQQVFMPDDVGNEHFRSI